jgi:hypothetical protein
MSRSEQRVSLLHPAAVPGDSVYWDVPFVFPWFGSVLRHVFVLSVNSECWVDIFANIWVESADELFYVHLNFARVVQIQCVPLATEPGISLIILPLMRILQRNLKRAYLTLQTLSSSCLTQRTYPCSNFVAVSSLVLELLKKCRIR